MSTNIIDRAQTLAVDGINATRVSHPDKTDWNGKKLREFTLFFAVAGAEHRDDRGYDENGKRTYNAIRVTVQHGYRKQYEATAKAVTLHQSGYSDVFGLSASGPAEITLAAPVPAPRYGRKGLDTLATQVFDALAADGFPRHNAALADLWDSIVESHGVARPALIPAAV